MPEERLFEETLKETGGFFTNRERGTSIPLARITEANDLIYNSKLNGRILLPHERDYLLKEALTTSDFPLLFGDVLDRQVLANYKAADPVWKAFTKQSTNRDFKDSYRFAIAGGDDALDRVGEKGEYLASPRTETKYTLAVLKYGRQFDISWEALINDDLGALKDTPARFAMAAVRTEHRVTTALYVHNVILATNGRGNLSVNPLTIANLETGVEWFAARTDANGEAIPTRPKFLVVPPALEMTAKQILESMSKQWVELGGAGGPLPYPTTNVVAKMGITLVVDPYITILDFAANPLSAVGGWYLFTDPRELAVLEVAHLRGHERPEIAMKSSDKVTVGGGPINPMSGDFATDNVFYRVRLVFGGTTLDWRGFYFGGHLD